MNTKPNLAITPIPLTSDEQIEAIIEDHFNGNASWGIAAIARVGCIPVHYLHPLVFEDRLGRPLTDEEWAKITPEFEEYDEFMDNSGASMSTSHWIGEVLELAGIQADDA